MLSCNRAVLAAVEEERKKEVTSVIFTELFKLFSVHLTRRRYTHMCPVGRKLHKEATVRNKNQVGVQIKLNVLFCVLQAKIS